MILTTEQLYAYIACPDQYMYKYHLGLQEDKLDANKEFEKAIRGALIHFYKRLLKGRRAPESELREAFQTRWYKPEDKEKFLFGPSENELSVNHKAVSMLNVFFRKEKYNPGTPIEVDRDFTIQIGDHFIQDTLDLVREIDDDDGKKKVQIVNFRASDRPPEEFYVEQDLRSTILSFGYRTINAKREDEIVYYMLKNGRQEKSFKGESDYEKMKRSAGKIIRGIESNIFYPRASFRCRQCPYQEICKIWPSGVEGADEI